MCCQTLSMEKSQSVGGSPVAAGSSPALKSSPIPEATSESVSGDDQWRPEPPTTTTKSSRPAAEMMDADKSPLNIAQAATSTITEWFGKPSLLLSMNNNNNNNNNNADNF